MITVFLDIKNSLLLKSKDITFHVLYYILIQSNHETGIWYADTYHKDLIKNKLGLANSTLDKHLASLKERELIKLESRGRYKINNEVFDIV